MPERRIQPIASSRDRVLSGATEEFAAHGYAGARIDRIARRVGLNVRMIYYHFGNKEGLYLGVLRAIHEHAAAMLERVQVEEAPDHRGTGALERFFDLLTAQPHFADILVREYLDGAKHLRRLFAADPDLYARIHRRANAVVAGAIEAGELRPVPVAETVAIVSSAVSFLHAARGSHDVFLRGPDRSAAEWKALLVDVLVNGLRPR